MPGLSGLEMAKHILAEKYNTKIILISAYEDFQYVQEAIRIGAVDYIEKPINFEYLYCVIKKALSQIEENKLIQKQLEESKPAMKENLFRYLLEHSSTVNQHKYQQFPWYKNTKRNPRSFCRSGIMAWKLFHSPSPLKSSR